MEREGGACWCHIECGSVHSVFAGFSYWNEHACECTLGNWITSIEIPLLVLLLEVLAISLHCNIKSADLNEH